MAVLHVYTLQPGHFARPEVPRWAAKPKGSPFIMLQCLSLPVCSAGVAAKTASGRVVAGVDSTLGWIVGWTKPPGIIMIMGASLLTDLDNCCNLGLCRSCVSKHLLPTVASWQRQKYKHLTRLRRHDQSNLHVIRAYFIHPRSPWMVQGSQSDAKSLHAKNALLCWKYDNSRIPHRAICYIHRSTTSSRTECAQVNYMHTGISNTVLQLL